MEPPLFAFGDRVRQPITVCGIPYMLRFIVTGFRCERDRGIWIYSLVNASTGARCERIEDLLQGEG